MEEIIKIPYEDWIKQRLPEDVPKKALERGFLDMGWHYIDGLDIMATGDRGEVVKEYCAADEDDLRLHWFMLACKQISHYWELITRKDNEKNWRYLRDRVENGNWLYIERNEYKYNGIEDSRLFWFEKYLALIKPVVPAELWEEQLNKHIDYMNYWFDIQHWGYDREKLCFTEISDSKKHDSYGTEEPRDGSIIKVV